MPELSIVSGTFNRLSYLQAMIASVRTSVGQVSYEIVFVDGGSTDGTLDYLRLQSDVKLIEHGSLKGAIQAFGDGAAAATGRYVVLANDDIVYKDDALRRAYLFMCEHSDVGIGCFFTNRAGRGVRVDMMPAHYTDGRMTSVYYGGLAILPRWLGNALEWWRCDGARTYGGDTALCARCLEAGWPVVPMEGAEVDEFIPGDALNAINNPPSSDDHPDTQRYLKAFPRGPQLGNSRTLHPPIAFTSTRRILYAPIYEHGHKIQHDQKKGLRLALQRLGLVWEIDYAEKGPDAILEAASAVNPDFVLTQLHYPDPFTIEHAAKLRQILPNATLVNWIGDVYNMATHAKYGDDYCAMLRYFDLHTVVNASSLPDYVQRGVKAAWWQNAYEPEGVGIEPDDSTHHHDAVFLGNGYSEARHTLGEVLQALPYDVGIYGDYWPHGSYTQTLYDFRRGCQIYRAAKIALGDSEWSEAASGFVSNRPFQAMAAGNCLMMQQTFDGCETMLGLKDGQHLILWDNHDDLRRKLAYWLAPERDKARAKIAAAGQAAVLRNHSFDARVRQLMALLTPRYEVGNTDPTLTIFHEAAK